ncbi:MAG: MFS transporter, partial [Dokdonella sp.]
MNTTDASTNPRVPALRLASFYFAYYAALGAFNPYWALYLKERGQDIAAISILMSLWYGTRIFAPSTWSTVAARSANPIRWLRAGSVMTAASFAFFTVPHDFTA